MRRLDGEHPESETRQFDGSHEERGQSWPRDVPRHTGEPESWKFGQDWPSDVPSSVSRPLVEDPAPRRFWDVAQVSGAATGRRRASRRSVRTANRPGRMRRWFSRFMELICLRS